VETTVVAEQVSAEQAVATESCPQCGAGLAHDQRYCLECGAPRTFLSGLQQLDGLRAAASPAGYSQPAAAAFSQLPGAPPPLGTTAPVPPHPPGVPPGTATDSRWGGPTGLIAGVGVLLLAMGVGVLIGRSGGSAGKTTAPPAQVITVESGSGSTAGTETGSGQASAPTTTTPSTKKSSATHKSSSSGATKSNSSSVGNSTEKPAPPSVVKNEKSKSGGSYEQKSKNLPNVISTG
jgi:hypothetical protein